MKKEKLIEILSKLPKNSDVYFWNGYVEDFNDINEKIEEDFLSKSSFESWYKNVLHEERRKRLSFDFEFSEEEKNNLKKEFTQQRNEWRLLNQFLSVDDAKKMGLKLKKIYLIDVRKRNKNSFDRLGNINY